MIKLNKSVFVEYEYESYANITYINGNPNDPGPISVMSLDLQKRRHLETSQTFGKSVLTIMN